VSDTKKAGILLSNKNCEGIEWAEGFLSKLRTKRVVKEEDMFMRVTTPMLVEGAFI